MRPTVHDMSTAELAVLADLIHTLDNAAPESDPRERVLEGVTRLLRADFCASFVWNGDTGTNERPLAHNMSGENLDRYLNWFQFRDPITRNLRARRRATPVRAVMPQKELEKSEFFNEFLRHDGLHHGINLFLFQGDRDLGDLRVWRARGRPDFQRREIELLDVLQPHLCRAFARPASPLAALSARERQVAELVARGLTDKDIAATLKIGYATVRSHLNHGMAKAGCSNRAELAALTHRY